MGVLTEPKHPRGKTAHACTLENLLGALVLLVISKVSMTEVRGDNIIRVQIRISILRRSVQFQLPKG